MYFQSHGVARHQQRKIILTPVIRTHDFLQRLCLLAHAVEKCNFQRRRPRRIRMQALPLLQRAHRSVVLAKLCIAPRYVRPYFCNVRA